MISGLASILAHLAMLYYALKTIVSALIIVAITEVAKRSTVIGD
jgi:hypothetical protein